MPLYGHELSEAINPYAAGVGWAVKLDKGEFVGREALRGWKRDPGRTRVGLRLEGKRIARQGTTVLDGDRAVGTVTSGTFSPTLQTSLAMALVEPVIRSGRHASYAGCPRPPRARRGRGAAVLPSFSADSELAHGTLDHCRQIFTIRESKDFASWTLRQLRYSPTHEWVHLEGTTATVGISQVCRRSAHRPDHDRAARGGNPAGGGQELRRDRERQGGERPLRARSAAR